MADDLGKRLEFYVWIPDYFAGKRWCEFFVMRLGQATVQFQSIRHFHDFSTFSKNLKKSDKSRKN